jgi:SWI/SNF-related matrix-associated actin-dependent regulator 1 of chromatin subfamily A
MPNRPMDLYTILSRQAPETIGFRSRFEYGFKYCGGYVDPTDGSWVFKGHSNMDELRANVHGKFMLRIKKGDVLKDLPPKNSEVVVIGENLPKKITALDKRLSALWGDRREMTADDETDLSTLRKEVGISKISYAVPFIKDALEASDEKILIFAFHKKVIAGLISGLRKFDPYVITGATPKPDRMKAVRGFQKKKKRRVLIANYLAGGTGFTLTKATRVIFVEWSWVPAENEQAADRAHRYGQTETVNVQYLVIKNSLDRVVLETMLRKAQVTAKI